jgi:general secretion pathway protein N
VFKLPSWSEYAPVLAHPVFNETREPTPVDAVAEAGKDGEAKAVAQPINVTLTSIIMTPKLKLAIVRDNNSGQSVVVKVGTALEGEQSGWKLVEVEPRKAIFEGQGLGRQELELVVDASARAAPPMPLPGAAPVPGVPGAAGVPPPPPAQPPPATMATASDNVSADANNQARAEEIRKRIEERRRQLREEAERMRSQEKSQ